MEVIIFRCLLTRIIRILPVELTACAYSERAENQKHNKIMKCTSAMFLIVNASNWKICSNEMIYLIAYISSVAQPS